MPFQPKARLLAPNVPWPPCKAQAWQRYLECSLGGLELWEGGGHGLGLLELLLVDLEHVFSPLCAADHQTDGLEPGGRWAGMRAGGGWGAGPRQRGAQRGGTRATVCG